MGEDMEFQAEIFKVGAGIEFVQKAISKDGPFGIASGFAGEDGREGGEVAIEGFGNHAAHNIVGARR